MKLPPSQNISKRIDELIDSLKLNKAADTKIGGPLVKGVSGGERKRTSIGVELITDPSLIFLDEPTTGLDSFTASTVVEILKNIAQSGRTVISTIHQPNSDTFQNFDQLCLMAQGHIIYQNDAHKAVSYFASIGYRCPDRTNPADYFMNMMSIEALDDANTDDNDELIRTKTMIENNYKAKIIDLYEKYDQSELKNDADSIHPEAKEIGSVETVKSYHANFCVQFWHLLVRSLRNIVRLPVASYVKIISNIIVAIMIILVFKQLKYDTQSIQNRNGVLFFFVMNIMMSSFTNVTLIFPDERPVFLREQGAEMYCPVMYFFSKFFCELPIIIINATMMFCIAYFGVELNTESAKQPFIFYAYTILLAWTATGFGYAVGTLVSQKSIAVTLTPLTIIPLMLLSGFFVNQDNIGK